jgi:hypothetical protein
MPVIMMKIALNMTYEQESDEGAADNCVSWPDFVWVFAATALSCSANPDFTYYS